MSTSVVISIFISYTNEDLAFRQDLEKHLLMMQRQRLIGVWHDGNIGAGSDRVEQISEYLNTADIILLLISPDFLASDYCYSIEMLRAVERHQAKKARVIPIILRPVSWEGAPFASLQTLPIDGKPVTDWPTRDKAFLDIAENIRRVVRGLLAIGEAHSHMTAERYDQALRAYEQALQFDRRSVTAYAGKGEALLKLKRFSEALDTYGQALQLDPTNPASESGRGAALLGLKRYQEALSAFDQAISLDTTIASAFSGKGDVLFQLRRYADALDAYDKALYLNSNAAHLYASKGHVLEQLAQQALETAKQLGYNEDKHMEQRNHSSAHIHTSLVGLEKPTLLQTIKLQNPDKLQYEARSLSAIAMSPDGNSLASIVKGTSTISHHSWQSLWTWDVKAGQENIVSLKESFQDKISCIIFTNRQTILSSRWNSEQMRGVTQEWNMETGELVQVFPSHTYYPSVISANGQALVGIGRNEEKEYARVNGEERYFLPGERPKLVVVNLSTGKHLGLLPLDEDDLRGKYYSTDLKSHTDS